MLELHSTYVRLTPEETKKLLIILKSKQGNLKACSELTGLSSVTLNRAKDGLDISKKSAKTIRKKLLSKKMEAA